jgi:hypothetical protein
MRKALVLLAFLATTAATFALLPAAAHAGERWKLLGQATVSDRVERDVVAVTRLRGDFEAIRLEVRDRAVEFRAVTVHFANGEEQRIELRDRIPAGGESRVIDLEGEERVLRSIELVYDAQSLGGRAKVKIYGRS